MAERLLTARRNAIAAVLVVVLCALGVWLAIEIVQVRDRLNTALQDNSILAQQVRQLGGTPRVGAPGAPGPTGSPGAPGSPGAAGQNGRNGSNGSPGPAGPSGAKGATGASGPAGASGSPGAQGAQGPTGPAGPTGSPGPSGSPGPAPSGWTFTYLGTTYTCAPSAPGSTTYDCTSGGLAAQSRRKK